MDTIIALMLAIYFVIFLYRREVVEWAISVGHINLPHSNTPQVIVMEEMECSARPPLSYVSPPPARKLFVVDPLPPLPPSSDPDPPYVYPRMPIPCEQFSHTAERTAGIGREPIHAPADGATTSKAPAASSQEIPNPPLSPTAPHLQYHPGLWRPYGDPYQGRSHWDYYNRPFINAYKKPETVTYYRTSKRG